MGFYMHELNLQISGDFLDFVFTLPYRKFGQRIILILRCIESHFVIQNVVCFDGCCTYVCFGDCFMCVYFVIDTVSGMPIRLNQVLYKLTFACFYYQLLRNARITNDSYRYFIYSFSEFLSHVF